MIQRTRLIYNPTAGRELSRRKLPDILQKLEKHGFETSTVATEGALDAQRAAYEAAERQFDVVITAGGDGTINEVLNGLMQSAYRPIVGILPLGTTNDIARALGIPLAWEKAIEVIVQRHVERMDVGTMNGQAFLNVVGGGALTMLTYEAPSKMKTIFGQLAYYVKGLEKLPTLHPTHLRIQTPERVVDEAVMLFLVANTRSIGGFQHLLPDARWDDGLFDVLCVRKCSLAEFVRIVTLVVRGEPIHDEPLLLLFRASALSIASEETVHLNIDGEPGGVLPCEIAVLPQRLSVFAVPGYSTAPLPRRRRLGKSPMLLDDLPENRL